MAPKCLSRSYYTCTVCFVLLHNRWALKTVTSLTGLSLVKPFLQFTIISHIQFYYCFGIQLICSGRNRLRLIIRQPLPHYGCNDHTVWWGMTKIPCPCRLAVKTFSFNQWQLLLLASSSIAADVVVDGVVRSYDV